MWIESGTFDHPEGPNPMTLAEQARVDDAMAFCDDAVEKMQAVSGATSTPQTERVHRILRDELHDSFTARVIAERP